MTSSCGGNRTKLALLHSAEIDFPSASAAEFYGGKLYVFGDDATQLLVLSPDYKILDTIPYWNARVSRIGKGEKPDIESTAIIQKNGRPILVGFGSLSSPNRRLAVEYDFADSIGFIQHPFFNIDVPGVSELNVEGAAIVNDMLVFSNRGNLSHPVNHLIAQDKRKGITLRPFILPKKKTFTGISGLAYVREKDLLLFTASEEETANAVDDGAIGESYLGGIESFSTRNQRELTPDFFLPLSKFGNAFARQKIESVCVEKLQGSELVLHLVADNDDGKSRLFCVSLIY